MEVLDQLAVALGFATLAGLNLYLTVLVTGMAIRFHWIDLLPQFESLEVLGQPAVLIVAGVLFLLEFFADKIPWVDSLWDVIHTLIRPVGGSLLALQTLGDMNPAFEVCLALVAGSATLVTHGFKASTRLAINASPEPATNIVASVTEDAAVVGGSLLMWTSPLVAGILCLFFLAGILYFTPRLFRRIKANLWLLYRKLRAPAGNNHLRDSDSLPTGLSSAENLALDAELGPGGSQPLWAVPCIAGRARGLRGLLPNLFGKLTADKTRPGEIRFISGSVHRPVMITLPLDGCSFSHQRRFLSEDLVLERQGDRFKVVFRFGRGEDGLVDSLIRELESLQRVPGEPPAASATPEPAGEAVSPA